ncbi:unnamed protein product [Caenorhabditis angaria]|uniref:CYtochrome P450 family n=1 Tax=Caenorhabditis angaria TaxID=860376 RepID=A0A9P1ITA3_9PELO|nr:unnamed protein product [Caenorhabditis angaria]
MFFVLFFILTIGYLYYDLIWKRKAYPPGPTPLPFVGNIFLMNDKFKPGYKLWQNLAEQFGPVYTFWLTQLPIVVVTDWNLIKKHFIKDGNSYTGRPEFPLQTQMRKGPYGIIESFGDRWIQQRRFALHIFRDFGLGKNLMEEKIIGEMRSMCDQIKKVCSEPVDMMNYFDASVGSIINALLFGYRYDESNMEEFLVLKARVAKHMKVAGEPVGGIIGMYPKLGNLPILKGYKDVVVGNWESLIDLFKKQINEKLETIDYDNDEYSDYVEAFLKERKKHEHEPNFGGYEMEQLESVCFDLWLAGMETTSNTLYWALLYVLLNPEVREKIYEELDREIGSDRIITTSDKSKLNYINATINESQRMANLLPFNLSRTTTCDVIINGHSVPKDTVIVPQISTVMYDENIFPNAMKFNPDRFLENGQLLKIEELVPFSIGKRQCLGEGLARMELFIFFANLFNQFDISLDSSNPNPSTEKEFGVTVKAHNYKVIMKSRH